MNRLDFTIDELTNSRFENVYHDLIKQMAKQTQFTEIEVKSILMVYYKFVLVNGPKSRSMTKQQFFQLFKVLFRIYDLQIIERILLHLTSDLKKEVDPIAWVKLFSIFMSAKLEPKMKFAFEIYNNKDTIWLSREVVMNAAEKFFHGDDEDEVNELKSDMTEVIFRKFDTDRDGYISYDEYTAVVSQEPLYLEFLGVCLPSYGGMTVIAYCANILSIIDKKSYDDI